MKKSKEVVDQLIRYFGAKVIGTQLLVDAQLLSEDDTNDIDIAAVKDFETTYRIHKFLIDLGFVDEDVLEKESIYSATVVKRTKFSNPEYDKIIDVNYFKNNPTIYSIPELIKMKFERGSVDDIRQLSMAIFNKGGRHTESIKSLQDFFNKNQQNNGNTI